MYMLVWFWAVAASFAPAPLMAMSAQALESQSAAVEAAAAPLMTLGWVDEDDAPIF